MIRWTLRDLRQALGWSDNEVVFLSVGIHTIDGWRLRTAMKYRLWRNPHNMIIKQVSTNAVCIIHPNSNNARIIAHLINQHMSLSRSYTQARHQDTCLQLAFVKDRSSGSLHDIIVLLQLLQCGHSLCSIKGASGRSANSTVHSSDNSIDFC